MDIKIENYLSDDEIKEIVTEELRGQIKRHFSNEETARRLLSNLAYQMVYDEVDKVVPNHLEELSKNVVRIITSGTQFSLFDYDFSSGRAKSLGAKIVEETVAENKQLIKETVLGQLVNKDYTELALCKFESLAESFTHNIYELVEEMRKTKTN